MATGNRIRIVTIAADEITNKVPRTPVNPIFIRARRSARFSFVIYPLCGMINFMPQRETFRDLSECIAFINIFHGVLHSSISFTVHCMHQCLSRYIAFILSFDGIAFIIYRVKDFNL